MFAHLFFVRSLTLKIRCAGFYVRTPDLPCNIGEKKGPVKDNAGTRMASNQMFPKEQWEMDPARQMNWIF